MSFVVRVDASRWRANADRVAESVQAVERTRLVPVVKGDGYGLGQARLAHESSRLRAEVVAVGTVHEVAEVASAFAGDILVLEPYDPRDPLALAGWERLDRSDLAPRVLRTLSSSDGVAAAAAAATAGPPVRAVVEGLTSVRRFGFDELGMVAALDRDDVLAALASGRLVLAGLALHLPLAPATPTRVDQAVSWAARWRSLVERLALPATVSDDAQTVWVSHLTDAELSAVRAAAPHAALRPRVGTRLWLGDRGALRAAGTVLAVHPYDGSVAAGYRQRRGPRDGTLVVVSGGTAHGVALEAPTPAATIRQRVVAAGTGALEATGRALSPFTWDGRQRWFAEPPHLHVSLLWLPRGCVVPSVGDELGVDVRFTTARFDAVLGLD
jgi:Alanine racemase, N-terminal domain